MAAIYGNALLFCCIISILAISMNILFPIGKINNSALFLFLATIITYPGFFYYSILPLREVMSITALSLIILGHALLVCNRYKRAAFVLLASAILSLLFRQTHLLAMVFMFFAHVTQIKTQRLMLLLVIAFGVALTIDSLGITNLGITDALRQRAYRVNLYEQGFYITPPTSNPLENLLSIFYAGFQIILFPIMQPQYFLSRVFIAIDSAFLFFVILGFLILHALLRSSIFWERGLTCICFAMALMLSVGEYYEGGAVRHRVYLFIPTLMILGGSLMRALKNR